MNDWLFDTTYILLWFGINVEIPGLKDTLKKILEKNPKAITITTCSLIEGKWKAIRSYQKEHNPEYLERSNKALKSFTLGRYFQILDPWLLPEASAFADELLKYGHKDYMDCWIAGTARYMNLKLVTEDKELCKSISKLPEWKDLKTMNWHEFKSDIVID